VSYTDFEIQSAKIWISDRPEGEDTAHRIQGRARDEETALLDLTRVRS